MAESCELLQFLESRNPFINNCSLRSIATGTNDGISVNVDTAKDVGEKILTSMAQRKVLQHSFKKKDQTVTLSTSAVKVNNETMQIDPRLLFQRLITAGSQELGMTSWKRSSHSNFAAIHQQYSKPCLLTNLHLQMLSGF